MKLSKLLILGLTIFPLILTGCNNSTEPTSNTGKSTTSTTNTSGTIPKKTGFDDSYLELGFTFSETFPTQLIMEFVGSKSVDIVEPVNMNDGCYYIFVPENEEEYLAAYFEIVLNGEQDETYLSKLYEHGHTQTCYRYNDDYTSVIDSTKTYEVDVIFDVINEIPETKLAFYKVADLFDNLGRTTDTEWSSDVKERMEEYFGEVVPFIPLGMDYSYEDYFEEYGEKCLNFYDYSINNTYLNDYPLILTTSGYTYDEENDYYFKNCRYGFITIEFFWDIYGNEIFVRLEIPDFEVWPDELIDGFTKEELNSKYTLPVFEETFDTINFTYYNQFGFIQIYRTDLTSLENYKQALLSDGFVSLSDKETSDEFNLAKGYIEIFGVFCEGSSTYSLVDEIDLYVYKYENGHEETGIYLPKTYSALIGSKVDLNLLLQKVDVIGDAMFSSNNEDVVKIDGNIADCLKDGTVIITAQVDRYVATCTLIVSSSKVITFDVLNSSFIDGEPVTSWNNETGVKILFDKYGGNTAPTYYLDHGPAIFCYSYNSITISAPTGASISQVGFTYGEKTDGTMSCTSGIFSKDLTTWTGDTNSVTFTVTGERHFVKFDVTVSINLNVK